MTHWEQVAHFHGSGEPSQLCCTALEPRKLQSRVVFENCSVGAEAMWTVKARAVLWRAPLLAGEEGEACGSTESYCSACLPFSSDRSSTKGCPWCQLGICVSQNDLTGEHSCIMLKTLTDEDAADQGAWLLAFWKGGLQWSGVSGVMGRGPPHL